MTTVSVVIETDSVHDYDDITLPECLEAIARQTYPRELIEVVAADGGKTPALRRLERAGYRMLVCEGLRMAHSFPGLATRNGLRWFFGRAYGVGYYMVKMRQIESDLRGSALVRGAGLGWPLLALGKCVLDLRQIWENRSRLNARFTAALPLAALYEMTLFAGGLAALLRVPPPRWS